MIDNESLKAASAGGVHFSEADLRLVLESINEVAALSGSGATASVGLRRIGRDEADTLLRTTFGSAVGAATDLAVYAASDRDVVDIVLQFDLDDIVTDLRKDIAAGISRNRRLIDFLGGIPPEVTARLDAARSNPRMAAHLVATAADHIAWALRLRIQHILIPVSEHGRVLSWRGRLSVSEVGSFAGSVLFPYATSLIIEAPASLLGD